MKSYTQTAGLVHKDTMNVTSTRQCNWPVGLQDLFNKASYNKFSFSGHSCRCFPSNSRAPYFLNVGYNANGHHQNSQRCGAILCSTRDDSMSPDDSEGSDYKDKLSNEIGGDNEMLRENLERMVGADDATFSGIDLATLIRNKYGRSYDVQFIKKEFMGKNLLAFNIMWKYVEQQHEMIWITYIKLKSNGCKKSFPLTEEEYLLRLDDVVNTLKCWGAVSHIRNSLAKSKERPRIGKAVSIFIDMDESGGRANEWIYK